MVLVLLQAAYPLRSDLDPIPEILRQEETDFFFALISKEPACCG